MVTLLLMFAGLILSFKALGFLLDRIGYLLDYKRKCREDIFEAQIVATKQLRQSNQLPYYRGKDYQRYLGSWSWKIISRMAIQEMGGKCEFCGHSARAVHHIYYPKNRENLGLEDISSLCVVCIKCHEILHGQCHKQEGLCELCETQKATTNLKVRYRKFRGPKSRVCTQCHLIAEGFRDEAKNMNLDSYLDWVKAWQKKLLDEMILNKGHRE